MFPEKRIFLSFIVIMLITTGATPFSPILAIKAYRTAVVSSLATNIQASLTRAPKEVHSWQPALIFAHVVGNYSEVKLNVTVSVNATLKRDGQVFWSTLYSYAYSITMLPVSWAFEWYVTAIPGLPAKTLQWEGIIHVYTLNIGSNVTYTLLVDDEVADTGGYVVLKRSVTGLMPPVVLATVYDVRYDRSILNETLGLGPKGWVAGSEETVKTLIVAFDDKGLKGINNVTFEYKVKDNPWTQVSIHEDSIMQTTNGFIGNLNTLLQRIEEAVKLVKPDFDLPEALLPLMVAYAEIPPWPAGNYVMFRANATDVDENMFTSPMGFYYVVNKQSDVRVLLIDPHVRLWLLKENVKQLSETFKQNVNYQLPTGVISNMTLLNRIADIVKKYGVTPFHHWELLGKYYNLYIAYPGKRIVDLLKNQTEGGFEPHVITLSNLWLGLEKREFWDWDLKDTIVDGKSVLEHIIQYVKQRHAGVIATHGTLSDWAVWPSCTNHYKVGSRGHVGDKIEDLDVTNEKTVASLLGMPQLTLWEFVRDEVAKYLGSTPELQPVGCAVGSIPLQVPFIPLNQSFSATSEGMNHPILQGLPEEFEVAIPSIYNEFGFKAYTQVGWQLAMPTALAYLAWQRANQTRQLAEQLVNKLAKLTENATAGDVLSENASSIFDSLRWGLKRLYKSIVSANITDMSFNITLNLPNLGLTNLTLDIDYRELLGFLPAKTVAVSKDWLAAIIAHDKYWDQNGYRAVYFSFEPEASNNSIAEKLLVNAIEWVKQWQYLPITKLLGDFVRVSNDLADRFNDRLNALPGNIVRFDSVLLVEEGRNTIEVNASQPGLLHILIAHPTSNKVNVTVMKGEAEIYIITNITQGLTEITTTIRKAGMIELGIRADTDSSLNPAYITIKEEADTTPPSIWKVEHLPEHPEYEQTVTVKANITDQQSGVDVAILSYYNGSKWMNVTMGPIEGLYVAEVQPLPYNTIVSYKIYAFDKANNPTVSQTYSYVVIDSYAPTVPFVTRVATSPNYDETVSISANVTEPTGASGIKLVILSYSNGITWKNVTMTLESLYAATIPALPYGTIVQYKVYASDAADNWKITDTYSYTVTDNTIPEVGVPSWSPEEPPSYKEVTVNVSVTEPEYASGVENVTLWFKVSGGEWQFKKMTLTNGIWTATIQGQSPNATVDFYIESYDYAGNNASTQTYSYKVKAEIAPPSLPLEMLIGIGVTIAALIGIATYFVKFKKKNVS